MNNSLMTSFKKIIILLCASTIFVSAESNSLDNCKDNFSSFEKYVLKDNDAYTHEELESFCNVFNTKKSERFYDNPIESVCYNYFLRNNYNESDFDYKQLQESGALNEYELLSSLDVKRSLGKLLCFEHNEASIFKRLCPFFYNLINNGFTNIYNESYLNDIKEKICRNKDCLNNVTPFYESLLSSYKNKYYVRYDFRIISKKEAEIVQNFINYLKSDECVNYKSDRFSGYNEKCGPNYGMCNYSSIYNCCSKEGRCGQGEDYCERRNGCNMDYGICISSEYYCGPKNSYKEVEKKQSVFIKVNDDITNNCGPGIGRCGFFRCCNKDGYCVMEDSSDDSQCQIKNGCQANYAMLKYIKPSKIIMSRKKCISGIGDNDYPYSQQNLRLQSCDRHDMKQIWELISDLSSILN
ncbi:hypothetical protein BCR32DRAFT_266533 [Anaeromyces robustus]|uniref:Chitin-binding type-1 domain-containing protein n=1 Tax=Anaeromyces robustus TaxID=1754192 RepID=A0A1Y1XED5_9FUNG|nr:hypothetical protein BCR32DRAFT_266533 [Anaeromyces robustus]|eukprot:ORX84128.1 hypothetical protein BCR32DRAFT_266533 [Anaeromyces robustus]